MDPEDADNYARPDTKAIKDIKKGTIINIV
jgi:hypothetical protein